MLKKLETLFDNKIWNKTVDILFPLILVVFSLMHINEGITVTDTGYNYGNFVNFATLDDMWKFSTYLSCSVGALFANLPFGNTMLGLNFYTCLLKTFATLFAYYFCTKICKMPKHVVFLGEMIALGLCWCPTALIYNYLTYLLFLLGAMLLYLGLIKEKKLFFILAGVFLSLNVFVRLPNVAECALIVVVWITGILYKQKFRKIVLDTMFCLLGYVIGLLSVFMYIVCRYGFKRYVEGIKALFAMTSEAESYTVKSMIMDMIRVYLQYFKWFFMIFCVLLLGVALFLVCKEKYLKIKSCIFAFISVFTYVVLLKKEMFNFNYREYFSMFAFGVLLLMLCLIIGAITVFFTKREKEEKVLALIVCVVILITPLGSNNNLYSPINNLFIVAPFFINYIWHLISERKSSIIIGKLSVNLIPYQMVLVAFAGMLFMQSVLFGANFVFRDGDGGEKREFEVENNKVLIGMKTTEENAENLQELNDYINKNALKGEKVILFGNVPAVSFYFELKPALSSTWPDLASFSYAKFERELKALSEEGERPLVLVSANPSDVGEDENAEDSLKNKWECLSGFLEENRYEQVFKSDAFILYSQAF